MKKGTDLVELKIVPIGNSKGVRLPKVILERYAITGSVVLEVREEGLVFRNDRDKRLSWADTFKDMSREREAWQDIEDATIADGLDADEKMVTPSVERYAVYLANLDPTRGSEIAKTRPVVVISQDDMNRHLDTAVVCPLTFRLHPRISKSRLTRRIDALTTAGAVSLRGLIVEMYGE